jgi:hypothetical protein
MRPLFATVVAVAGPVLSIPSFAAPTDQQAADLKARADALSEQVDQVPKVPSAQAEQLASQHWQQMQDYMRSFPAMRCPGCGGMMSVTCRGPMRGQGMQDAMGGGGMMHGPGMCGGMMGGAMMVDAVGRDTHAYHAQMRTQIQAMREQIARAQATSDPAERERLLQEPGATCTSTCRPCAAWAGCGVRRCRRSKRCPRAHRPVRNSSGVIRPVSGSIVVYRETQISNCCERPALPAARLDSPDRS